MNASAPSLPSHVGIIMDGNGRWARSRSLPRTRGHREGLETAKRIVAHASSLGISALSLYAFSTENWRRTEEEVGYLLGLVKTHLRQQYNFYREQNIRVVHSGDIQALPDAIRREILLTEEDTRDFKGLTVNLLLNYGGRDEILRAVNRAAGQAAGRAGLRSGAWTGDSSGGGCAGEDHPGASNGKRTGESRAGRGHVENCSEDFNGKRAGESRREGDLPGAAHPGEAMFPLSAERLEEFMDHPELGPLDLLIRSGGELRISNFMLWQAAYAELYFDSDYWPDWTPHHLDRALEAYAARQRRFGGLQSNSAAEMGGAGRNQLDHRDTTGADKGLTGGRNGSNAAEAANPGRTQAADNASNPGSKADAGSAKITATDAVSSMNTIDGRHNRADVKSSAAGAGSASNSGSKAAAGSGNITAAEATNPGRTQAAGTAAEDHRGSASE